MWIMHDFLARKIDVTVYAMLIVVWLKAYKIHVTQLVLNRPVYISHRSCILSSSS